MIKKITSDDAIYIINSRKPFGLFYLIEDGTYIGIDNSNGHAWTEEFPSLHQCKNWLLNPSVIAPSFDEAA